MMNSDTIGHMTHAYFSGLST